MADFHFPEEATWKPAPRPNEVTVALSNDVHAHWLLDPCVPTTVYPTDGRRLAMASITRIQGESFEGRQIAVYPDAATAAEVMAGFRRVLAACSRYSTPSGSTEYFSAPLALGDEALLEWDMGRDPTGAQRPGGGYDVVVRDGRSVYLASVGGEFQPKGPNDLGAGRAVAAARAMLPLPQ